jgi:hypothetical protein
MLKKVLFAGLLASLAASVNAKDAPRCAEPESDVRGAMDAQGIIDVCQFFDQTSRDSALELVPPVVTGRQPYPLADAVASSARAGAITFAIPAAYTDYVVCGFGLELVSELPPLGGFVSHGWTNLTGRSIDFEWTLRQRGLGRGTTRLRADLHFSFLPAANLERARNQGLCARAPLDKPTVDG